MRAVVSGYYGFRNLGDEAILAALVQQLGDALELVVLSRDPAWTETQHAVRAIGRTDALAIARELRRADLFISGGGGLLQDATGPLSIPYYAGLMRLSRWLGTPYGLFGQGIGPIHGPLNRKLAFAAARGAAFCAVRDEASRRFLMDLGMPGDRIQLTADPVLCLEPAPSARIDQLLATAELGSRPVLGVAIRPWPTWMERQFKAFSAVLAQFAARCEFAILILPFQVPGDERIAGELYDCLTSRPRGHAPVHLLEGPLAPEEMLGLVGRLDLVVGMRLHSLIMAANQGVPAIGIAYDPKVAHFARQWGFPAIPSVEALGEARQLEDTLLAIWDGREATKRAMREREHEERARALENFAQVRRALGLARRAEAVP